ncbi:hypothetical protein R3P38DRAFT_3193957 [Favolaschia claudopus]|uniref:Uncharacterized protein n=1 Tax=Favolaschia claudopus TaxID=2862362 RepID=A0AAW0BG53_9AGAR
MDHRPLGPRQPQDPRATAAYQDIFGRRPRPQQPLPPQQQQQYYQQQQPYPPRYQPQQQQYYYPQQQQQYVGRPPSLRPSTHQGAYHPGVAAHPPDRPRDAQGLTPAQAYQAQVAQGHAHHFRSPSPGLPPIAQRTQTPQHAPSLSLSIGGDGAGHLGIDFEAGHNTDSPGGFEGRPKAAGDVGVGAVAVNGKSAGGDTYGEEDDEESELPWARPPQQLQHPFFLPITFSSPTFSLCLICRRARVIPVRATVGSDG